jgi:hypothetical protein
MDLHDEILFNFCISSITLSSPLIIIIRRRLDFGSDDVSLIVVDDFLSEIDQNEFDRIQLELIVNI